MAAINHVNVPEIPKGTYGEAVIAAWDTSLCLDAIKVTTVAFQYFDKYLSDSFKKTIVKPLVQNLDKIAWVKDFLCMPNLFSDIKDLVQFPSLPKYAAMSLENKVLGILKRCMNILSDLLSMICFVLAPFVFFNPVISGALLITIEVLGLIVLFFALARTIIKYYQENQVNASEKDQLKQAIRSQYLIFRMARSAFYILMSALTVAAFIWAPVTLFSNLVEYFLITGFLSIFIEWFYYGFKTVWKAQEKAITDAQKVKEMQEASTQIDFTTFNTAESRTN